MKVIIHILIIFLIITKANGQCNFEMTDSIHRDTLEANWLKYKNTFKPEDIGKYPLVFQNIPKDKLYDMHVASVQRFKKYRKPNSCEEGNYYTDYFKDQWVNKYYKGQSVFVSVDSVQYLDIEKFPYVFMFYSTEMYDKEFHWQCGRQGVYIWDRRIDEKYSVINACGKREMIWLLKNL